MTCSHGHAKRDDPRRLATSRIPLHSTRSRLDRPPPHVHGKEGVDGSSPSEGLTKCPANWTFRVSESTTAVTRGGSRGLSGVPLTFACACRLRLERAHSNSCDHPLFASGDRMSCARKKESREPEGP